jgi:hypothetical protein
VDLLALFTKIKLLDVPAFPSDEVWRNYVEDALSSRYRNRELE